MCLVCNALPCPAYRWLMHKGRELQAYTVWRKIRGFQTLENKQEFFLMRHLVEQEEEEEEGKKAYAWLDFFTVPRARRAIFYATFMVWLGQFTGVNAIVYYMSVLLNAIGFDAKSSVFVSNQLACVLYLISLLNIYGHTV